MAVSISACSADSGCLLESGAARYRTTFETLYFRHDVDARLEPSITISGNFWFSKSSSRIRMLTLRRSPSGLEVLAPDGTFLIEMENSACADLLEDYQHHLRSVTPDPDYLYDRLADLQR